MDSYMNGSKIDTNKGITSPTIPDPDNLPQPQGWTLLVRPYPVVQDKEKTSLIIPDEETDFISYLTNVGRVVSVGPCCWNRPEHRNTNNERFDWAKVGDFVSYPKNSGAKRKFKGVSYVLLVDDEIVEVLPDPLILEDDMYKLDIPQEDLEKYNSIYSKNTKGNE